MKCFVWLLLAAGVVHAAPSPAQLAGPPPATATKLASGVVWTTLVRGHGAHPAATDWVTYYGGSSHEGRDRYYLAKPTVPTNVASFVDLTSMTVGEKRRYWVPAVGPSSPYVEDIELAAILGPGTPTAMPQFPPPSDAQRASHGDRYVVVDPATAKGPRAELTDRVFFDVTALDRDGKPIDIGVRSVTQTLGDVAVPAVVDTVRAMNVGEHRRVWTKRAGQPLWLQIRLYSIEKRAQLPAPPDVAHAPASATIEPGVQYVVIAPGTGEPADSADDVTLDYAVWTTAGRTVESSAKPRGPRAATGFVPAFTAQVSEMRVGEHRRIWFSPAAAGYLSENGLGAVADVTLVAIDRKIDLLPRGLRIVHDHRNVEVVRGASHVTLPLAGWYLESAQLSNGVVTFTGETDCGGEDTSTIPLSELEAMVDDAEAMQQFHAGALPDAIASATKAVSLAPELPELHADLATIDVKAGKTHEAAQTLAVVAALDPVWVYVRVKEHPELAVLAGEPEIKRLRVRAPAAIDLDKMPVLVEPSGRFVAVPVEEGSWGSDDGETRIEIIDVATATIVSTIPRVMWSYMSQPMSAQIEAEVAQRKHQVETWLAELGFTGAKGIERGTIQRAGRGDPSTTTFANAKITVNQAGDVVHGTTVLGHAPGMGGDLHDAYWLPTQRVIVFHWGRAGHEGCESTDPQGVDLVKLR